VPELPPHELRLKVGCPVLLLRNLDAPRGLCNGTRLRVQHLDRNIITCTILGSARHGTRVDLPRIPMFCGGGIIEGLEFQRRQFPVRLAFAMTINKA
jgi:ATP-dependent DNA helicase PIF1